MARTGEPATRHVAAVAKAIGLLDALAEAGEPLGTNELARRTGVNPSSVSRLLATLTAGGLIQHVPATGRYQLGPRLLYLASATLAQFELRDLAQPHLRALSEVTGETATLSLPGETEAITLDFVQSPSSVQSVARVGRPSVAHATAVGKVFLAWGGRLPDGPLPRYTDRTIVDPDRVAKEADTVRRRGVAFAFAEREPDLHAIAVPVLDHRGELAAILGVQGPSSRFTRRAMRAALEPLQEHAAKLAQLR
jgi:DNA-binding IclR family transcriptional regulator